MGVSDYSFVIDQGNHTLNHLFIKAHVPLRSGPKGTFLWRIFDVGGVSEVLRFQRQC
jgi:hypothetical protein